ncbi:hypothetical protein BT69DRAFT_661542 [Atractiella rhizophila]|nr:hypothetical protein BT69DRAFT_661542 [Atractiella rhizophila]
MYRALAPPPLMLSKLPIAPTLRSPIRSGLLDKCSSTTVKPHKLSRRYPVGTSFLELSPSPVTSHFSPIRSATAQVFSVSSAGSIVPADFKDGKENTCHPPLRASAGQEELKLEDSKVSDDMSPASYLLSFHASSEISGTGGSMKNHQGCWVCGVGCICTRTGEQAEDRMLSLFNSGTHEHYPKLLHCHARQQDDTTIDPSPAVHAPTS